MAKWIEGTLAAMIWSWFMFLLMMKKAIKEKRLGLDNAFLRRSFNRHGVSLRG